MCDGDLAGPNFRTRMDYERALGWNSRLFIESEMALFLECRLTCVQNMLDTADIVREATCQQPSSLLGISMRVR